MNNIKLVIRNVIGEPINGISRVTVSQTLYDAVKQSISAQYTKQERVLKYHTREEQEGKWMRVFNIEGMELYAWYERRLYFFMKTEDAKKCIVTLDEERSESKLPLHLSQFNLNIVASAA